MLDNVNLRLVAHDRQTNRQTDRQTETETDRWLRFKILQWCLQFRKSSHGGTRVQLASATQTVEKHFGEIASDQWEDRATVHWARDDRRLVQSYRQQCSDTACSLHVPNRSLLQRLDCHPAFAIEANPAFSVRNGRLSPRFLRRYGLLRTWGDQTLNLNVTADCWGSGRKGACASVGLHIHASHTVKARLRLRFCPG